MFLQVISARYEKIKVVNNVYLYFRMQVLDTFLSLRIKQVSYTDPIAKAEEAEKKEHNDKLSRREKKVKQQTILYENKKQTFNIEELYAN